MYGCTLQVPLSLLDELIETTTLVEFKYSDAFFCCGYLLKIGIGKKNSNFRLGLYCPGLALDFVKFLAKTAVTVERVWIQK